MMRINKKENICALWTKSGANFGENAARPVCVFHLKGRKHMKKMPVLLTFDVDGECLWRCPVALRELKDYYHSKKAFIVTDANLFEMGMCQPG